MIRAYRPDDLPALRRICLLTGDDGTDATGRYPDDGLLPDAFLEPYATLVPETCWVAELEGRPAGYLVAALDTAAFFERWRDEWAPVFRARHPHRESGPEWLYDVGDGEGALPGDLAAFAGSSGSQPSRRACRASTSPCRPPTRPPAPSTTASASTTSASAATRSCWASHRPASSSLAP